ncbi:hypothetical protein V5799_011886, partial [Amblyomma americanum]
WRPCDGSRYVAYALCNPAIDRVLGKPQPPDPWVTRHSKFSRAPAGPPAAAAGTMMEGNDSVHPQPSSVAVFFRRASQSYQRLLDTWTPHTVARWVGALLLLAAFLGRILYLQGWYIITYALGIYHLNLFIAFLTPKVDPALGADDYGQSLAILTKALFQGISRTHRVRQC